MIYWFTGQPGSGKTTLAQKLYHHSLTLPDEVIHLDGDDTRDVLDNKDYSEKGRKVNIQFAMNMAKVLDNKGYTVICSFVSPYRDMREKFKSEYDVKEFYCHTTETRGRENYFVENYEPPLENFIDINTDKTEEESFDEILNVCG